MASSSGAASHSSENYSRRRNTSEQDISCRGEEHVPSTKSIRHPKHLKGKQIGMFYARLYKNKLKAALENDNSDPPQTDTSERGKRKREWQAIWLERRESMQAAKEQKFERLERMRAAKEQKRERRERMQASKEQKYRSVIKMGTQRERYVENLLIQLKFANVVGPFDSSDSSDDSSMEWASNETEDYETNFRPSCSLGSGLFKKANMSKTRALKINNFLNDEYKFELENKVNNVEYCNMMEFRKKLPSYNMRQEIVDLIESNQVVVLTGETGCGKTTQVPQFILDYYIKNGEGSMCRIVCTQPRRISATSVAERVAQERAETCGNSSIGYQIRLEKKQPRETASVLYCTTGIMLQWLHSDPELLGISHIILDEIHERTLESDFLIIILKDLLPKRPNLKLILMSATLNAELFSKYFYGCPMLNIPGFTYPVKEYMLEDVLEMTGYCPPAKPNLMGAKWKRYTKKGRQEIKNYEERQREVQVSLRSMDTKYSERTINALEVFNEETIDLDLIAALIKHICMTQPDGAILVFLPGWEQISKCHTLLTSEEYLNPQRHLILPLHSLMPTVNQREIFNQPPFGVRKIILSTNIAETSITIDDIVYVIDCGKIKISNFDVENNIATLKPEWVSRANARQRRGRAGRTQPGVCYHLFTKLKESQLSDYLPPEIMRIRLEELCLKIKILQLGNIKTFISKAMEAPHIKALELSVELLKTLNALDSQENLTPLGYHLAQLPLDPFTGKMILFGAIFSCLDPILTVAASLSFKDAFLMPLGQERQANAKKCELAGNTQSDHLMLVQAFFEWENASTAREKRDFCQEYFLSNPTLSMLNDLKKQFARYLHELRFLHCDYLKHSDFNMNSDNEALIKAIICAGLYPNVAKLKIPEKNPQGKRPLIMHTKENGQVEFHPKSVNYHERRFRSQWLVYYQKVRSTQVFIHDTTVVSPYSLLFFGGKIAVSVENGIEIVTVDDYIIFNCPRNIAHLIMGLRCELDKLLKRKISHPGVTNWDSNQREGAVLRAIADLITYEEYNMATGKTSKNDSEL